MKRKFLTVVGFCVLLIGVQARADGLSTFLEDYKKAIVDGKASTSIGIDNDSLLLNRDDGLYTSGLRLRQEYVLRDANRLTRFGWRIGQELYTASNINLPPALIGPPDHPYAGWLYGGLFKETNRADGTHLKVGLDIGCIGPCAGGEWMQTNLHRLLRQPLPQGWGKQVRNEFGVVLYADMAPVRWNLASWLDATPNFHGRFGNIYTDAGAGITVRAGTLPALPDQPGLHGFLRVDTSAVAYNAMMQGGYFSDNNLHTVKPKRLVGEAELGLAWNHGPYGATASLIRRSNEIKDLPNRLGAQNFVRLVFSYSP
jgi:hypothetical protein